MLCSIWFVIFLGFALQGTHLDAAHDDKSSVSSVDEMLEALAHIVHKISCEVGLESRTKLNNAVVPFTFHKNQLIVIHVRENSLGWDLNPNTLTQPLELVSSGNKAVVFLLYYVANKEESLLKTCIMLQHKDYSLHELISSFYFS